jgi:protein-S-isoprenylcysteine O-methyltransferase Ste14
VCRSVIQTGELRGNLSVTVAVYGLWGAFWLYWLIAAFSAKEGSRGVRARPPGLALLIVLVGLRLLRTDNLSVHSVILRAVGLGLLVSGLGLAVWARIYLGRNWGMPMTKKDEPELVTSGPYRFVRHPIYSGILLGVLGSALATNLYWLIALAVIGGYFVYSATAEERWLSESFPVAYPAYKEHTKMLVPFLL